MCIFAFSKRALLDGDELKSKSTVKDARASESGVEVVAAMAYS